MQKEIKKVELRNLQIEDYKQLRKSMIEAYPDMENAYWGEEQIKNLLNIFPEGQLVIVADDIVVGSALSIIVPEKKAYKLHDYKQITANYKFSTHTKEGDILYGIDVFVHPEYRGLRLGRRLYDARKELCEQLNLKAIVFAGRIPNYSKFANQFNPKEYIEKVNKKEIYDPVLSFQLSNDFQPVRVMRNYLVGDKKSQEFAVLLDWNNIFYEENIKLINVEKSVIRLGLIQWQMRPLRNLDALFEQAEFFIDAVSGYGSDFALFPELFTAPLMADYNHLSEAEAIKELAKYTEAVKKKMQEFAISHNINIITGSMPLLEDGHVYNVGFLCRRDGSNEMYRKIHITPNEVFHWVLPEEIPYKHLTLIVEK